jgi:antitoxin component HigA of HigAB toxin-antitoxin module
MLVHLCPGAWEIVHKPKVRELSIVASPAYKTTEFHPVGFAAAMNDSQYDAILKNIQNSQLSEDNKDVGSRQKEPQEPENKKNEAKEEVKHLSEQNAQKSASPHQAQGVVNVAPGESAPKQVTYQELMDQVTKLQKQIGDGGVSVADSEIDALGKKIADLEAELGKRAKKAELSKKVSDLTKQLQTPTEQGESGEGEAGFPPKAEGAEAEAQKNATKASGKGIVAVDEIQKDVLGNYDWFKDILKAHRMLQTQTFKG